MAERGRRPGGKKTNPLWRLKPIKSPWSRGTRLGDPASENRGGGYLGPCSFGDRLHRGKGEKAEAPAPASEASAPPNGPSAQAEPAPEPAVPLVPPSGGQVLATPTRKKTARDQGVDLRMSLPARADGVIPRRRCAGHAVGPAGGPGPGIDLSSVPGTGYHGKVTKSDVLAASQAGSPPQPKA